ncbi:unnamed protein product [Adineta ricciae]|uniref:NAD(P)(+)--arginine ADP-ribosyltransferase n=1 Tax=Adineta ricciae TaxID=249248 RepID=A0A816CAQ3_ADIRI|nr:unnamed protein product [Adineta ricciae]CAF1619857.1 unnamed protein product [Adineta ricciae]
MSQLNRKSNRSDRFSRRPSSLRTGFTIILYNGSNLESNESDKINNCIRALDNCYIFHCTNNSKCIKYLKRAQRHEYIVIVFNGSIGLISPTQIAELCQYKQIQHIFIISRMNEQNASTDTDLSVYTRDEVNIIAGVFRDCESLGARLQQLISEVNESDDDLFTFVNQSEKALRNLRDELGPYIWSQTYRVILSAMPYSSQDAKRDMLIECRACCYLSKHDLKTIDEFRRTYTATNAIYWYTKSCFLYRIINRALRTEDNLVLYKFRFFIIDLCTRLEEKALTKVDCTQPLSVYRGSKLRRDEVEKLEVGSLVATNSFFSSSKHLSTAQNFIGIISNVDTSPSRGRHDRYQYVLFKIDIDLHNSPDIVVADVSNESAVPDENEMLFNLGTTFVIGDIRYDEMQRVWNIRMTSSSEAAKLMQEYRQHVQSRFVETKPAILFGHFTSEISSNYHGALNYFHRLLRSTSWNDEDRPDIYYCLGRVYRAMGKHEQAITYLRAALLLQRRLLPDAGMVYGRMLSCLGSVFCETGDSLRAKRLYEQAMLIYQGILPKNHYEFGFHLNRLANVYWQLGQYELTSNLLKSTLLFVENTMPEKSSAHAQTLHIMGLAQRSLNNRKEAIHYFQESIKVRESSQANDHPYVARTCYELSELYAEENNYSMALEYAHKSLHIRELKLPQNHPQRQQSIDLVERLNHLYHEAEC